MKTRHTTIVIRRVMALKLYWDGILDFGCWRSKNSLLVYSYEIGEARQSDVMCALELGLFDEPILVETFG